jgi:hypothetical protein
MLHRGLQVTVKWSLWPRIFFKFSFILNCCSSRELKVDLYTWCNIFLMTLQPLWALAAFQSPDLFTIGRTPWTVDQLVARPLPKHRTAQTHIHTKHHAHNRIRTHDHIVQASEGSLGYGDWLTWCNYLPLSQYIPQMASVPLEEGVSTATDRGRFAFRYELFLTLSPNDIRAH